MAPRLRSATKPRRSSRDRKPVERYSPVPTPSKSRSEQKAATAVNTQKKKKTTAPKKTGRPFSDTPFGKLPTELRIQILSNLLHVDYTLDFMDVPFEHRTVGLTHICRTLRGEALHVLYGTNTFLVDPGEITVNYARHFNPVDRYRVSLMKQIVLLLDAPQACDWDVMKKAWLNPLLHIEDYGFRNLKSIKVRIQGSWWYLWDDDPYWKEEMRSAVSDSQREEFLIKTREGLRSSQIKAREILFLGIDAKARVWLRDSCVLSTE